MIQILYLGAILLLRVVQSISGKSNSREMPKDRRGLGGYISLRLAMSAAFALLLLLLSGEALSSFTKLSAVGLIISCATGVTLAVSTVCSLLALQGSSIVLGKLFSTAGLLVPTVSSIFLFGQSVGFWQWGGILCLFISAVLLASSSEKTNGKLTARTLLLLFGNMLANGTTMLLQTMYKAYVPNESVTLYSFLQFFIPSAVMLIVFLLQSGKGKESPPIKFSRKLIVFTALSAVAVFGISQISTVASAIIPAAVLFPISDGGGTVVSAIVAAAVYKERITWKSALGIVVAIIGICVIKLL